MKHERCKRYPIDWVHTVIENKLGEIQLSADIINSYKTILTKMFEVEDGDRKKSINHLKSELEKLEKQKEVLQDHFLSQKLMADEYREMKQRIDAKAFDIKKNLEVLEDQVAPIKEYLQHHVPMLENLLSFFQKSDGKTKNRILSCILDGKIHFNENKDAAITFTPAITALLNASKNLVKGKKEKEVKSDLLSYLAPAVGLEPTTL